MRSVHLVFQRESKHLTGKKFICDDCGLSTLYKPLYEAHKAAPNCNVAPTSTNKALRRKKPENSGPSLRGPTEQSRNIFRSDCIPRARKQYSEENSKKFKCDKCTFSSDKKGIVKTHTQQIHEKISFKCEIGDCNIKYRTKYNLKVHVDSFHKGITFDCVICSKKYPSIETLKYHTKETHERVYDVKCQKCDFVTYYQKALQKHLLQGKCNDAL